MDVADILGYALPWPSAQQLLKGATSHIASTIDKYVYYRLFFAIFKRGVRDLLRGLEKVGFRTNSGIDGVGLLSLIFTTGGGFYIGISLSEGRKSCSNLPADTGASREIINGNIKVKSGFSIRRFVSYGLELEDGTELECDVVIFATGYAMCYFHFARGVSSREQVW